jgi:uncharacterized membrane protein
MLKVPPRHELAIAAACVALNLAVGKIASLLSLPLPLDTIGSVTGAALLPPVLAIAVGAVTAALGWAVISPVYPDYIGTQISVVIAALAVLRFIGFDRPWKAVILGASVAMVAALVSAIAGIDAVPVGSGRSSWSAATIGGLPIEVADKLVVALVAWALVRRRLRGSG